MVKRKTKYKTTCFILLFLYPEFYKDINKRYGADTYSLRCELGERNCYYLCAEDDKVFLVVSAYIAS